MAVDEHGRWGRVDETGAVFVREGDGERLVGEFPDVSPEEALAYYERKYTDLAGSVSLLEQRARRGTPATEIAKSVTSLRSNVEGANAVGDLAALLTRLDALSGEVEQLTEQQSAEAKAAVDAAVVERTEIVAQAEALAATDPARTQWKQATAQLDELFQKWQAHQHDGPRIPKRDADELWRRFKAARGTVEHNRRTFFAELDSAHKDVRTRKAELIERAEKLSSQGAAAVPEYRSLLDSWKTAGRAGKRADDALWARFKAAGDAIYAAKAEVDAAENEEYSKNLEAKLALLTEAEPLATATDRSSARSRLTAIQRRWDEIGRVPRDQMHAVEDRLRRIESAVRKLEDEHWNRSNPEKQARSDGLASQLAAAIEKLEAELAEAKASGDASRITSAQEALDARRVWLDALR